MANTATLAAASAGVILTAAAATADAATAGLELLRLPLEEGLPIETKEGMLLRDNINILWEVWVLKYMNKPFNDNI